MNQEEMYYSMNKGIPNMIKLELSVDDLINYCAEDRDELTKAMMDIRRRYENAIVGLCGYNKSNHEFFSNLRLVKN